MTRTLKTATLEKAARDYAGMWMRPNIKSPGGGVFVDGPGRVMQDFFNADFKDEFDFLVNGDAGIKAWLGGLALAEFEKRAGDVFEPREDKVFVDLLKHRLAIDPDGNHIAGEIGTVQVGVRPLFRTAVEVKARDAIRRRKRMGLKIHDGAWPKGDLVIREGLVTWPVYAGEAEERIAESGVADDLPDGAYLTKADGRLAAGLSANVPNISAESAIAACDAIVDSLDEGSTAATIRGRTGSQPVDPEATETGTLLFTLTCSDPAFNAAADATPGGQAAADTITDDSSADATGTLGYCRAGATGTGADDHIDGEAGTSSADFVFNTLSIVSGAAVSMSSFTVTVPQGSTAT